MPGLTEEQKREEDQKRKDALAAAGDNDELQADLLEEEVLKQGDKLAEAQNASGGKQVTRDEIRDQILAKDRPRDQSLEKWIDDIIKKLQQQLEEIRAWRNTPKSQKPKGVKATAKAIAKDAWEQVKDENVFEGALNSLSGGGYVGIAINVVGNITRDTASGAVGLAKTGVVKAGKGVGKGISWGAKKLWEKVSGTSKEVDEKIKKHSQDFDDAPKAKAGSMHFKLEEDGTMTRFEVRDTDEKVMGTREQQDEAIKFANYVNTSADAAGCKVENGKLLGSDDQPLGDSMIDGLAESYAKFSGLDVEIEPEGPKHGHGL